MSIDPALASFLASPVTIIVGTGDGEGRPEIGRAVGARVEPGGEVVELVVSSWQWPGTAGNLRASGRAAATFARPSDYVCYQVRGRATIHSADAADVALSDRYMTAILAELERLGLAPELAAPWLTNRDAVLIRIQAEEIYLQTPGAKAGQLLGGGA